MGIEFVDLTEPHLSHLRREVMQGRPLAWQREVKVWFEGTSQPTRATATTTVGGISLGCELGFLRLGSQLVVYGSGETALQGVLSEVALRVDPVARVPRLLLAVLPRATDVAAPDGTWTHWPPPPVRELRGARSSHRGRCCGKTEFVAESDEVIIEAEPLVVAEEPEHEPLAVSGSIVARDRPGPPVPDEPSVQARAVAPPPGQEWRLGEPPAIEDSHWQLGAPHPTLVLRPRRRGHPWLWLGALAMCAAAALSMSYTKSWLRVRDQIAGWLAHVGRELRPTPISLSIVPLRSQPRPVVQAPRQVPQRQAARAHAQPAPATQPLERGIAVDEARREIAIPIVGSLDRARPYLLARPTGVAINLPAATPNVPYGDYSLQRAGFRTAWVRRRAAGGLHLRVFFHERWRALVQLTANAVQIRLRPAQGSAEEPVSE
jgi:hypothetical protein